MQLWKVEMVPDTEVNEDGLVRMKMLQCCADVLKGFRGMGGVLGKVKEVQQCSNCAHETDRRHAIAKW